MTNISHNENKATNIIKTIYSLETDYRFLREVKVAWFTFHNVHIYSFFLSLFASGEQTGFAGLGFEAIQALPTKQFSRVESRIYAFK